jgi:hypothetical protein
MGFDVTDRYQRIIINSGINSPCTTISQIPLAKDFLLDGLSIENNPCLLKTMAI